MAQIKSDADVSEYVANVLNGNMLSENTYNLFIPEDIFSQQLDFNELIDGIRLIPLETNEQCLIGEINKILAMENGYIIFDKRNKNIFQFNKKGKFLKRIGNIGNGPHEYTDPYDVSLDTLNKQIIIVDLTARKLVKFDYDGDFVKTTPMYFLFQHLEKYNNHVIYNLGGSYNTRNPSLDQHKLAITEENFDSIYRFMPYERNIKNSYSVERPLRKFGDDVFYYNYFTDTIWKINNVGLEAFCNINFQGNGWGLKINEVKDDQDMRSLFDKSWYFNGDFVISNKYIFIEVFKKDQASSIYYSVQSGKMLCGSGVKNAPNRLISIIFRSPHTINDENDFVSYFEPFKIVRHKEFIENDPQKDQYRELYSLLDSIDESDNPILIVYSLHTF
ncbi:6-bladed beta-propeller [Tangfeifania diversioriginum]|nr:6-bladed beta-propeller [Tangfeifania diversioriginum]